MRAALLWLALLAVVCFYFTYHASGSFLGARGDQEMSRTRWLSRVAAVCLAGVAVAGSAAEAGVEKNTDYRFKGGTADGTFQRFTGCDTLVVLVSGNEDLRSGQATRNTSSITVHIPQ
jgi:hypothetical protein